MLRAVYWVVQRRAKRKNWSVDCNKLCSLPLDLCNAKILSSKGVNVSYHSWVSQVGKGIIDDGSVRRRGMERSKISVPRDIAIEVCMGEGPSMERGCVDGGVLRSSSL